MENAAQPRETRAPLTHATPVPIFLQSLGLRWRYRPSLGGANTIWLEAETLTYAEMPDLVGHDGFAISTN